MPDDSEQLAHVFLPFIPIDELQQGAMATTMVNTHLGDYHLQNQHFTEAIRYYEIAMKSYFGLMSADTEPSFLLALAPKIKALKIKIFQAHVAQGDDALAQQTWEQAINAFKQALVYQPNHDELFHKMGLGFQGLQQWDSAIVFLNHALQHNPKHAESYRILGDIYSFHQYNQQQAIDAYLHYTELHPSNARVWNMLCHLYSQSDLEKSFAYAQQAVVLEPGFITAVKNMLWNAIKMPQYTQQAIFDLTVQSLSTCFQHMGFTEGDIIIHEKKDKKEYKIHIGYISGDFCNHPVLFLILPLLERHDYQRFTVTLYSNVSEPDPITEKCRTIVPHYKEIQHLSDKETAALIAQDQVDILVDLGGHTGSSRISVLAYKPAPVQVIYTGYPNTTGIPTVDYFFTHPSLSPPQDEPYFSEQFYYIEPYFCYHNFNQAHLPDIAPLPALKNGYMTFCSFNQITKMNDDVLALWAQILKEIPTARLLICRTAILEESLLGAFQRLGIEKERLILDKAFSLEKYNLADIQLDTFPFNGVGTTIHSIEMGVPVLTLFGHVFQSRLSAYINKELGLTDFIAATKEEYVGAAIRLSEDLSALAELRNQLRPRFYQSTFKDYSKMTQQIEHAYQDIWNRYQRGQ